MLGINLIYPQLLREYEPKFKISELHFKIHNKEAETVVTDTKMTWSTQGKYIPSTKVLYHI